MDHTAKRVYVAGSTGMVGSSIVRGLNDRAYRHLLLGSSSKIDLTDQSAVKSFFAAERPEIVVLAAAKVGGIAANDSLRAEFLYQNLMIEANIIHSAFEIGVEKLIFLASSCIYPRLAAQPIIEEALLTGLLEPTNEPYAIAKIAGVKLCESYYRQYGCNYFSAMPTNLYGPNDNYDLNGSHVIPALIHKFHTAKLFGSPEVNVWGTGEAKRDFLYVDDLAEAIIFLMENVEASDIYDDVSLINVGSGSEVTISELAVIIKDVVGYDGAIVFDTTRPDGTPRKLLDISRISKMGWRPRTDLLDGLRLAYADFLQAEAAVAGQL